MDPLWKDFRSAPLLYLSAQKLSSEAFVSQLLQTLTSEDSANSKLVALGIIQEMDGSLFSESEGIEKVVYSLLNIFLQQRNVSSPLICSQMLCTITTLLIEMQPVMTSHEQLLVELVNVLFDVIEKVKTDSNRLLKSVACDCLKELEIAFPGLLCAKVGNFYGMSQAESSYIQQNYMALFCTVLEHAIQKFVLEQDESSPSNGIEQTLSELLTYAEPLKSFGLPERFIDYADKVLKTPPTTTIVEGMDVHEVKKGVSFFLDQCQLMTPSCIASVMQQVISCVQTTALSPKMLKSLLMQFSPCFDVQLFHIVLQLKLKFGVDICDEGDEENISRWLQILACHPSISTHYKCLLFQWILCWPHEENHSGGKERDGSPVSEDHAMLQPCVFDSLDVVYSKLRVLSTFRNLGETGDVATFPLKDILVSVLKLVRYDIAGGPGATLYRLLFAYYTSPYGRSLGNEISRLLIEIATRQAIFIPQTIDFLSSVEKTHPDSSLPVSVLAEFSQCLATADIKSLLSHWSLQLLFLKYTATHTLINPLVIVEVLARVLKEGQLCGQGSWETGTAILDVCNTLMKQHKTRVVFKELADLLQLMAKEYQDLDIQDRARFYRQLLLTVSGGKLSAILTLASDTSSGSSLSDIVEARISNAVFPSAPPVHRISNKFLSLERIYCEFDGCYTSSSNDEESSIVIQDLALNSYLESLQDDASPFPIRLQYRIRFTVVPEGVSQRIYALVLKLNTDGPYHPSPDVYVPYLVAEDTSAQPSTSKVVTLTFYPRQPVPQTFNVSAIFTTEDGLSCTTDLPSIVMEFENLFQPIPKHLCQKVPPAQLFSMLWSYIEDTQHSQYGTHSAALSTSHLEQGQASWEHCTSGLHGLLVPHSDQTGEEWLLIFVAPRFHLLMKFSAPSRLVLATDYWKLLPLINDYIHVHA